MSKLFLVMNSQQAWELNQVYRDHVINEKGPEMVVSKVGWRSLGREGGGVAMITLEAANSLSMRELGDRQGLRQTGRPATKEEIQRTFGTQEGTTVVPDGAP